jgi:hypothetical protein
MAVFFVVWHRSLRQGSRANCQRGCANHRCYPHVNHSYTRATTSQRRRNEMRKQAPSSHLAPALYLRFCPAQPGYEHCAR